MKAKSYFSGTRGSLLFLILMTLALPGVRAQVLIPAASYENIYPTGVPTGDTPSCYSYGSVNFGGPLYDTYLAGINGQVIWRMTTPGNPAAIFNQGTIAYPNCVDVNVGFMIDAGGQPLAVVAYYKNGAGHKYDVYKWTTTGLSLLSSTALSLLPSYTRISMDSHKTYGMVITWEEATDVYAVTGLSGVFSTPILLGGTTNMKRPDVAFSHSSALNVHFVYHHQTSPTTYDIYESVADFFALNSSGGFFVPTVQDVNPVTVMWSLLTASIDCPDHYSVENWAYTYAIDGVDVYTRSIDFNTLGFPITTNVVNGTIGNLPMPAKELRPRTAYNKSCITFHVAWYSSFFVGAQGQCYFAEEIKESAGPGSIVSSPDYELVAANSNFPPGASLNSIAFSKQNDANNFLYTVFLDKKGVHHKFHKWPQTTAFRTSGSITENSLADQCSAPHVAATSGNVIKELAIGPNPFAENVYLYVPASLKNELMTASLTDLTGKLLFSYEGAAANAPASIETATKGLTAGTYFLSTSVKSAGIRQNFKLQCVANSDR